MNQVTNTNDGKLSFNTKLSYGIGGICDNALYTLAGTYLMLYLTTVAGISPAIAGTISAIGSVWEALCAPVVGYKSDRLISRFGRRKTFLMAVAFPIAIIVSMLFTTIEAGDSVKVVYYTVMVVLFWTVFSSEFIPYMSWGSDLTEDYNERTVLRSFSYVFNQVGMCIGMVLPTIIVDYYMNMGKTTAQSWQMVGIFVGVCCCVALLLCTLTIRKDDLTKEEFAKLKAANPKEKRSFIDMRMIKEICGDYIQILKLKPIRFIVGMSIIYLIANITFSSDRVFFMTYNLKLDQGTISMVLMIITVAAVAFVPFIVKFAEKFDKRNVFAAAMAISGISFVASKFIGINSLATLIVVCLLYAMANACYWQLMPSMLYDVCEVEELYSGQKHTGAVISLQALSESLSIAVGVQMLGIILEMAGFNSEATVQTAVALDWVENAFVVIPGIAMIFAAVLTKKYPVTKDVFNQVKDMLERKRNGEEVDPTEIPGLF